MEADLSKKECEVDIDNSEFTSADLRKLQQLLVLMTVCTDDAQREVWDIPSYKNGADIDMYIRNLEADIRDLGMSQRKYTRILMSKLTPKARELIDDLRNEEDCT